MRLVQVFVPADQQDAVVDKLDDLDAEYLVATEADERGVIAYIPVPTGGVDPLLAELRAAGLDDHTFTVVSDIETTTTPDEEYTSQFVDIPTGGVGVSYPELQERADDLEPTRVVYVALAMLSAIVAAAGLFLDSAIVVVGAMVLAPFAGSTLSASVGVVVEERETFTGSVVSQALGIAAGFVGAAGFALVALVSDAVPASLAVSRIGEINMFVAPTLPAVTVAICAGAAGALALATDLPVSIAGVAVAAAIVPSIATAAIGTVWGHPVMFLGATVLLAINIVSLNVSVYVTLLALGYGSPAPLPTDADLSAKRIVHAAVLVSFLVLAVVTAGAVYNQLVFKRDATKAVESTLATDRYDQLELTALTVEYNDEHLFGEPTTVTVVVSQTTTRKYPDLDEAIRQKLATRTDTPVVVRVHIATFHQTASRTQDTAHQRSGHGPFDWDSPTTRQLGLPSAIAG